MLFRSTMGVVKLNIAFTAVYNLAGLSLAALGILPPIVAAVAQSIPDVGILLNSARLLNQTGKIKTLKSQSSTTKVANSFPKYIEVNAKKAIAILLPIKSTNTK